MPQRFAIGKNEMRTVRSVVRFAAPFTLNAVDGTQDPGDYAIDQDEEAIEGLSRLAFQRVASFIYLPAIGDNNNRPGMMAPITSSELDGAVTVAHKLQTPQTTPHQAG